MERRPVMQPFRANEEYPPRKQTLVGDHSGAARV